MFQDFLSQVRLPSGRSSGRSTAVFGPMALFRFCVLLLMFPEIVDLSPVVMAQDQNPGESFLNFVKNSAVSLRASDAVPKNTDDWSQRRASLKTQLEAAWGGFPSEHAPLEARILESLERPDYRIEKIVFQTFRGVWMTANAWVPKSNGRHAAVLCVHGHWQGAKQDSHVQARCAGLAKLGFFVLAVDAFGAGERAIGKALGEYHGEMAAATLWPVGRPLSGIQVYENMRAVDYLISRPEVDAERIGITGASGGGNQSMYAGAWDERLKAVVPVCSVGNYQAYLGAACCMCEVVPGVLTFTEESDVLAMVAPRALLVVSATRDAFQFSVGEARKSINAAQPVFRLFEKESSIRHEVFDSPHDYNQPMREAMYGFMTLHLKNQGDGAPVSEPELHLEEPETLRCFPGESRPDEWVTLPQFAAREAEFLQERHSLPKSGPLSPEDRSERRNRLSKNLRVAPESATKANLVSVSENQKILQIFPEPGIALELSVQEPPGEQPAESTQRGTTIVVTADGQQHPSLIILRDAAIKAGERVAVLELRATGRYAWPSDRIGRAPDHNTAEWSIWIGRPLLGQWVGDIHTAVSALLSENEKPGTGIHLAAHGPAALAALAAAGLDDRVAEVTVRGLTSTFVSDKPYQHQRLGMFPNAILRDFGDVIHIAALIAPRPLKIESPVDPQGEPLSTNSAKAAFHNLEILYQNSPEGFSVSADN